MPLISLTRLMTNFKVRNMLEEKPPKRYGIEGICRGSKLRDRSYGGVSQ